MDKNALFAALETSALLTKTDDVLGKILGFTILSACFPKASIKYDLRQKPNKEDNTSDILFCAENHTHSECDFKKFSVKVARCAFTSAHLKSNAPLGVAGVQYTFSKWDRKNEPFGLFFCLPLPTGTHQEELCKVIQQDWNLPQTEWEGFLSEKDPLKFLRHVKFFAAGPSWSKSGDVVTFHLQYMNQNQKKNSSLNYIYRRILRGSSQENLQSIAAHILSELTTPHGEPTLKKNVNKNE